MSQSHSELLGTRRRFLKMGVVGGVAGLLCSGLELAMPPLLGAQTTMTPAAALDDLMAGNKRFVAGQFTGCGSNIVERRRQTANKQEPFAAVLTCADSRVPAEIVFDKCIGDLFVSRVAGNMITSEIIGSLEYGAAVLGTKVILVLGHANCGAVKAAMHGESVPGQISSLYPHLQAAVNQAGGDLQAAIKANAKIQATLLSESSTVIAGMVKDNKIKVVAGYYDLESGAVTLL